MPRKSYTMKMVEDKRGGCFGVPIWLVIVLIVVAAVVIAGR